jgi:hypothetical protein
MNQTELSSVVIKLLRVRSYVDTVRRAAEHQAQESGQWFGFVEPCEDAVLLIDEIEAALENLYLKPLPPR